MATRSFACSKDSLVCLSPTGLELGAGEDDHLPAGVNNGYKLRSLLAFTLDWTGVYEITKAELKIRTSASNYHGTKSSDTFYISRCTSSWSEGTYGADESWYAANAVDWGNQPSTTTTGRVSYAGTTSNSSDRTYDITAIVKAWAPTSIPGGGGASNYGIQIRQTTESEDNYTEFQSVEGGTNPYILLTYVDTPPQTNPTVTIDTPPSNGLARITNLADINAAAWATEIKFTYADAESHAMSKYRVKVFSDSGKTSLVHDSGDVTGSWATGTQITYVPSGWGPTNGTDYWLEVTVWDSYSTPGSGSDTHQFRVRMGDMAFAKYIGAGATALTATITPAAPVANTQRAIWYRLADNAWGLQSVASAWVTATGSLPTPDSTYAWLQTYIRIASDLSGTNPQVGSYVVSYQEPGSQPMPDKWGFAPAGGSASLDVDIRRYGSKSLKCTQFYSGGTDGGGVSFGGYSTVWPDTKQGDGYIPVTPETDYVFTAEVRTERILTGTRMIYLSVHDGTNYLEEIVNGQQAYLSNTDQLSCTKGTIDDHALIRATGDNDSERWTLEGTGVDFIGLEWGNGGIPYNGYGKFYLLRAVASGGLGYAYHNEMVPVTPGETVRVKMRTFTGSAETPRLYLWWYYPDGTNMSTDFWTLGVEGWKDRSYDITVPAGAAFARIGIGQNRVSASVDWMGFDNAELLRVVTPTNLYPDGWKRLRLAFRTGAGITRVRPLIVYFDQDGMPATFWLDGAMLTEGTVAPSWTQGTVAAAGTLAASGVQLDGATGAILRYRGTDGGVRSVVEGGTAGLILGGDTQILSPTPNTVAIVPTGTSGGLLTIAGGSSGSEGAEIGLDGSGSNTDWHIDNYAGQLRMFDSEVHLLVQHDSPSVQITGDATITGKMSRSGEEWTAVSFTNSWVNYGSSYAPAAYRKDAQGFVHLRGLIKSGTLGSAAFTLPAGFRPGYVNIYAGRSTVSSTWGVANMGRVDIETDGDVIPHATLCNNGYVSLEGIVFLAEN